MTMQLTEKPEIYGVRPYQWTLEEYHRAGELGLFPPDVHLELVEGILYEKMSEDPSHSTGIGLLQDALTRAFSLVDFCLRVQNPITLPNSEPEPDLVVAVGQRRQYASRHPVPGDIALVVEVANTTLLYDRQTKAEVYAAAGIAEYWILNVSGRQLEVHRTPQNDGYQLVMILGETQTVSPLAAPGNTFLVQDLLP